MEKLLEELKNKIKELETLTCGFSSDHEVGYHDGRISGLEEAISLIEEKLK